MWCVIALQVISGLLMFQPAKCASCDQADWGVSLDRAIWSTCPKRNTYLRGLWRSPRQAGDERVGRIESGRCCKATESIYANQSANCSNANWGPTLDGWVIRAMAIGDGKVYENIAGSKFEHLEWRSYKSTFKCLLTQFIEYFFIGGWKYWNYLKLHYFLFRLPPKLSTSQEGIFPKK